MNESAPRCFELHGKELTSVPESVGRMAGLEELSLWRNQLTALPDFLWDLTSLRVLNVSENKLSSLSEKIGRLTRLETLDDLPASPMLDLRRSSEPTNK